MGTVVEMGMGGDYDVNGGGNRDGGKWGRGWE